MDYSTEYAAFETGLSKKAVVFWYMKFRRVCSGHFRLHPILLGGFQMVVECDETFMSRRHGRRGRRVRRNPTWVIALIERGTGLCYLKIVRRRNAATLIPIILSHVRAGSTVQTDEWRSYRALLRFPAYRRRAINHGQNFVDPLDPQNHTQLVENLNGRWKKYVRNKQGIKDRPLPLHLKEFMWRQRFGSRDRVFFTFWSHAAEVYPCR